ncbi:MAG: hypothetical protein QME81_19110, partial [bacterium]|nr:hypothetical protein [bacterium]
MSEVSLRCYLSHEVTYGVVAVASKIKYRDCEMDLDLAKNYSTILICPSCGAQIELTIYPALPFLKAIKCGLNEATLRKGFFCILFKSKGKSQRVQSSGF